MCGRFSLALDTERLVQELGIGAVAGEVGPRWNIAPTQDVAAVVRAPDGLRLGRLRWGLLPARAASPPGRPPLINARAETVHRRPAFREAFRRRRCWIPADGFYEWRRNDDGTRTPFHFRLPDGRPFVMAGLWDRRAAPDGSVIASCAIVTTAASVDVAPVHDRMPVILPLEQRGLWLDPDPDQRALLSLLRPFHARLEAVEVSPHVNRVAHDDPACTLAADGDGNIQVRAV